jgi:hypothetical protein
MNPRKILLIRRKYFFIPEGEKCTKSLSKSSGKLMSLNFTKLTPKSFCNVLLIEFLFLLYVLVGKCCHCRIKSFTHPLHFSMILARTVPAKLYVGIFRVLSVKYTKPVTYVLKFHKIVTKEFL